jgi:hypothetical protein
MNYTKFRPIGIEMTFVPEKYHKIYDDGWANEDGFQGFPSIVSYTRKYTNAVEKFIKSEQYSNPLNVDFSLHEIHDDPGCVEHPSPILKSEKEAKYWTESVIKIAKSVGLVPFHEDQLSGGGHIHVGGLTNIEKNKIMLEAYKHPYLSWIFLDPNSAPDSSSIAGEIHNGCNRTYGRMVRDYFHVPSCQSTLEELKKFKKSDFSNLILLIG